VVEIVLGVSMTPTTVSIALVEGEKADGVIVERDVFDITAVDGSPTSSASDHVIAAVLGTQEGAIAAGHHLVSTGVSWTDHAQAAVLREALVAHDIEDVLLVSELHAAAALAQAIGRAVGYDKTALMFVERDTATLAVVETADGSVVKVLSQGLHSADTIAVLTEMVTSLQAEKSMPQGMFVVGSGVDVTAVKAHLNDLVSVPAIAPEEPQVALARGAALASANAPRFDAATVGLAYSQDLDGTTAYTIALADDATTFLGHADSFLDTADIASDSNLMPPFLLVGSSLTAIFVAGVTALAIAMVITIQPTADRGSGKITVPPSAAAPPPASESAQPAAPRQVPTTVPAPAQAAPQSAATATARLKVLPAPPPPPRVVVRNAAPAPAAPPPAPAAPPPVVVPPAIPPPLIQWLPPILQPPPYYNPQQGPPWYPGRGGPPWRRGGDHKDGDDHKKGDDDKDGD
jgi:hypothetical protein